jgi:ParB-like chromosome segregation protein Spo0J
MIQISCEVSESLPLSDLTEFQGELKMRTDSDYEQIQSSLRKYGIAFPFFVWRDNNTNNVLDGHGRLGALQRMAQTGEKIPDVPVVYVEAETEIQAKNLLLRLNSRYGEITTDGMKEFLSDVDADLDGVNIPELPDIAELLDKQLSNAPAGESEDEYEPPQPKFEVFCPECGEQYEISDEELKEAVDDES